MPKSSSGPPGLWLAESRMPPAAPRLRIRCEAAGVESRLQVYDGVLHGFLHYSRMLDRSRDAIDHAAQAIRRAFALETT